jgi:hypothetical protein
MREHCFYAVRRQRTGAMAECTNQPYGFPGSTTAAVRI